MTAIELSATTGLVAMWLLTANLLLGLLLGVRYNPWTHWPHRRFNYFEIHNWTGYIALAVAILHPSILLFSADAGFGVGDLLWPLPGAPHQPLWATLGALALYLLAVVVVSSYYRRRLGRGRWKTLHYVAYFCAALFYVHGIVMDPKLKDRPVNWIDAEKVQVELAMLSVLAASLFRLRHALRRRAAGVRRPPRHLPRTAGGDLDLEAAS